MKGSFSMKRVPVNTHFGLRAQQVNVTPNLCWKEVRNATIEGIKLTHRIRKSQFVLISMCLMDDVPHGCSSIQGMSSRALNPLRVQVTPTLLVSMRHCSEPSTMRRAQSSTRACTRGFETHKPRPLGVNTSTRPQPIDGLGISTSAGNRIVPVAKIRVSGALYLKIPGPKKKRRPAITCWPLNWRPKLDSNQRPPD